MGLIDQPRKVVELLAQFVEHLLHTITAWAQRRRQVNPLGELVVHLAFVGLVRFDAQAVGLEPGF